MALKSLALELFLGFVPEKDMSHALLSTTSWPSWKWCLPAYAVVDTVLILRVDGFQVSHHAWRNSYFAL
jgi:hypothetical protein